jgi:hypothetical protein
MISISSPSRSCQADTWGKGARLAAGRGEAEVAHPLAHLGIDRRTQGAQVTVAPRHDQRLIGQPTRRVHPAAHAHQRAIGDLAQAA